MVSAGPDKVSSILFSAPYFDDDFEFWSSTIFGMLEAGVLVARAESKIGIVCFHPKYATPDGKGWPGFGQMHSVPKLRSWLDKQDLELSNELTDDDVAAGGAWLVQYRTFIDVSFILRSN